jgi:hypothetical protein
MKRVELPHGVVVTTFARPPASFNPTIASAAELVRFGFPLRPTEPKLSKLYDRAMRRMGRFHYLEPVFDVIAEKTSKHGKRVVPDISEGRQTTNNWSGAQVVAPANDSIQFVMAEFVVPNASSPSGIQNFSSSHWIGIDDGSDICQTGVECNGLVGNKSAFYAWFQWYPGPLMKIPNFIVSAGDMLNVLICTDSGYGSTGATIYFTNEISGIYTSFRVQAPPGTVLSGNCAEWISEVPELGGLVNPIALADFGEVFFSSCYAGTVNGAAITSADGDFIDMLALDNQTVVCSGTQVSSDVVRTLYEGPIPV